VTELEATPDTDDAAVNPSRAARFDPSLVGSLVAALVVGAGLSLGAHRSALDLLIAVAVVQGVLAFAFVFGTGMPGRKGAIVIAALAAGGADATASVWPHGRLGALIAVVGLAVPVMFVHQLSRGAARTRIVSSLSAVSLLVLSVVALAALLQLRHEFVDAALGGRAASMVVASVAGALVVGYLVDMVLPFPRFDADVPRGVLALIFSAAVGGALGYLILRSDAAFADGRAIFIGAALGALAGLLAVAAAFVLATTPDPETRLGPPLRPVLAAVLPLCLLAPAGFLLCLAIRS
jgi:hypothetical protein